MIAAGAGNATTEIGTRSDERTLPAVHGSPTTSHSYQVGEETGSQPSGAETRNADSAARDAKRGLITPLMRASRSSNG